MNIPSQNMSVVNPSLSEVDSIHQAYSHMNIPSSSQNLIYSTSEVALQTPVHSTSMSIANNPVSITILPRPSVSDQSQKRRSSSRSIKRKKFDDELVESSLKTTRSKPASTFPALPSTSSASFSPTLPTPHPPPVASTTQVQPPEVVAPVIPEKKKSRPPPKRVKKSKNSQPHSTKDIGRWKPTDDLALILAVQQTNDLETVYRGVKFSCKFTVQEIQERWYALLYDHTISKVAFNAMKQLHLDVIGQVQAKALFSEEEEKLIAAVPSNVQASVETFQEMLDKNPDTFMSARTAKVLFAHWTLMRHYNLLSDQIVSKLNSGEFVANFSDAEELIDDAELNDAKDEDIDRELRVTNRFAKREIKLLENELPKWQVLVDSITGVTPADFDSQTLAVLKGRFVRYLMRSQEITIGRAAKDNTVDIDLALEGPAWKVSRKQGLIKLENSGEFFLINEGRRPFFVDGKPVLTGNKCKLANNSVVEIVGLRFIFLVNQELTNSMKVKWAF